MKILDKYILKTFAKTFFTVFAILFFIFILQAVWLFLPEIAGKDLGFWLIVKFFAFKMPGLVPMILPLSVLLSAIMTFGDLSENYELAAMKSAGISFKRALVSTTAFIIILTIVTFFFANNVIPYSEYKFINFRKNIAQVKPALAITQGQFSNVGAFSIKVDKKFGENENFLKGITIHEKSLYGDGNKKVIKAKDGQLISNEKSNYLKLVLNKGYYYEDIIPVKWEDKLKLPFAKSSFASYTINIDLNKLNSVNLDDESVKNSDNMLTISELKYTLDSLNKNYRRDVLSFSDNIYQRTGINNVNEKVLFKEKTTPSILSKFDNNKQSELVKMAMNNITSTIFSIDSSKGDLEFKYKVIGAHWISVHFKFVIAFSCILMFFIGAPLGAIIRKGGLGLPMVFAVLIFIIFHFVNTFGKKVAEEGGVPPFVGCWLSTLILGPLAILFTYRAVNDIGGNINFDVITEPIKLIFQRVFAAKNELDEPKTIVTNLLVLERNYLLFNKFALVLNLLLFVVIGLSVFINTPLFIKISNVVLLYIFSFFAHKNAEKINNFLNKKPDLLLLILFLFSLPFYSIFYFYNKKNVSEPISIYLKNNSAIKTEIITSIKTEKTSETDAIDYLKLKFISNTKFGLVCYFLALISLSLLLIFSKQIFIIIFFINNLIMYLFVFKAHKNIESIDKKLNRKSNLLLLIFFLFSMPLFVLFGIYGKKLMKNDTK